MKAASQKLSRHIEVKFVMFGRGYQRTYRASPHCGFSARDRERIIENVIEELDTRFPQLEFRQVDIGPNKINFIHCGNREAANPTSKTAEAVEATA